MVILFTNSKCLSSISLIVSITCLLFQKEIIVENSLLFSPYVQSSLLYFVYDHKKMK